MSMQRARVKCDVTSILPVRGSGRLQPSRVQWHSSAEGFEETAFDGELLAGIGFQGGAEVFEGLDTHQE